MEAWEVGGALAIALAAIEALKFAIAKFAHGHNVLSEAVSTAEWRTKIGGLIKSQQQTQHEILELQRKTVVCLERLTDKVNQQ